MKITLIALFAAAALSLAGFAAAGSMTTGITGTITSSVSGPGTTTGPDPNEPSVNELAMKLEILTQRVKRDEFRIRRLERRCGKRCR